MKNIYQYIVFGLMACCALLSCQREEEVPQVFVQINEEIIEPSYTSVILTCNLTSNFTIEAVRAYVSPTFDFEKAEIIVLSEAGEGTFSGEVNGLREGTHYYVRYEMYNHLSVYILEQVSEFQTFSYSIPTVYTKQVTDIDFTSARVLAAVKTDGGATIHERGVCYSQSANPTVDDTKVAAEAGLGDYSCMLLYLEEGTTYHVRAYAVNANGTYYGEELTFTTEARTYHEDHEYVDLGLSVKWATANIGEDMPQKAGDYFAWGEIIPKTEYDWSTYLWCNYTNDVWECLTKYNTQSNLGAVDKLITLTMEDDAAHYNWGGDWRMPTAKEIAELLSQCDWEVTATGYEVISKVNGKSIFLRAGGCMRGEDIFSPTEYGYYWSSGMVESDAKKARVLNFNTKEQYDSSIDRSMGCFIRPVYPK